MSTLDDLPNCFDHSQETRTESHNAMQEELSEQAGARSVIDEMRGAANELAAGFPSVNIGSGDFDEPLPPDPDDYRLLQAALKVGEVMLNPQPLPPGPDDYRLLQAALKVGEVMLNPQPLPPDPDDYLPQFRRLPKNDLVSLNPQPLPPRYESLRYGDRVSLNPQPLPPDPKGLFNLPRPQMLKTMISRVRF